MILARVSGRITSTIHHPDMDGRTLLICDALDADQRPTGHSVIAIDTIGAGPGQMVVVLDEGNGARQVLDRPRMPVRSLVIGIVDDVG
jgi:ethanolamine utilization protein EutN